MFHSAGYSNKLIPWIQAGTLAYYLKVTHVSYFHADMLMV